MLLRAQEDASDFLAHLLVKRPAFDDPAIAKAGNGAAGAVEIEAGGAEQSSHAGLRSDVLERPLPVSPPDTGSERDPLGFRIRSFDRAADVALGAVAGDDDPLLLLVSAGWAGAGGRPGKPERPRRA